MTVAKTITNVKTGGIENIRVEMDYCGIQNLTNVIYRKMSTAMNQVSFLLDDYYNVPIKIKTETLF